MRGLGDWEGQDLPKNSCVDHLRLGGTLSGLDSLASTVANGPSTSVGGQPRSSISGSNTYRDQQYQQHQQHQQSSLPMLAREREGIELERAPACMQQACKQKTTPACSSQNKQKNQTRL